MYCRNCGNQMDENAAFCVKCGVAVGGGNNYCPNCCAEVHPEAVVCVKCGIELRPMGAAPGQGYTDRPQKSKMTAGLLELFLPGVGRLYLGYTGIGVAQLILAFALCGVGAIWSFVDAIMILTGSVTEDAYGVPLRD